MDEKTLTILQAVDDPQHSGCPPSFDRQRAIAKVEHLRPVVEEITGRTFDVHEDVQDASFFTDLATCEDEVTSDGDILRDTVLAVRFSCFGELFTVWCLCAPEQQLHTHVVQAVIDQVQRAGYQYVDADLLSVDYSGENPHFRGQTWWARFFEYF